MGLFDLLKKAAGVVETLEDIAQEQEVKKHPAKTQVHKNRLATAQAGQPTETLPSRTSWGYEFPAGYIYEPELVRSRQQLLEDMKKLLKTNFSEYRIHYQVPASELDRAAHPASVPVTFVFEKNGCYLLAVFVVRKNTYKGINVVSTQRLCERMGMKCIRFFEEYANDDDYVVGRIRSYLS